MVANPALSMFMRRLRLTLEMIRFEHSVFALPFALTGALLALRRLGFPWHDFWWKLGWIVAAMVCARSAAMAFNRILDHEMDARNPRTRMRHLPAGLLSREFAWGFTAICSLLFVGAAWELNRLCFLLSPVALGVVFFYSFTKRFTSLSHLVLGSALGIARGLHGIMLACLGLLIVLFHLGWIAWAGVAVVAALLIYEHSLVRA